MEQKKPAILSQSSLQTYTKKSSRAVTLSEMWQSNEPCFAIIKREAGEEATKALMYIEVGKMFQLLNADMQKIHIEYLVDYILTHYYAYTISDITCLTDRLVKNNPYGKPILQNIIYELDKYSYDRDEYAVMQRTKEASKLKSDPIEDDKFLKMYDRMKKEAKNTPEPETQKEREQRVKIDLEKKMAIFQQLYPG